MEQASGVRLEGNKLLQISHQSVITVTVTAHTPLCSFKLLPKPAVKVTIVITSFVKYLSLTTTKKIAVGLTTCIYLFISSCPFQSVISHRYIKDENVFLLLLLKCVWLFLFVNCLIVTCI